MDEIGIVILFLLFFFFALSSGASYNFLVAVRLRLL